MRKSKAYLTIAAAVVLVASTSPVFAKKSHAPQNGAATGQIDSPAVILSAKGKGKGKGKGSDQQQYMQYQMHDALITSRSSNPSGGSKGQSGNAANTSQSMSPGKKR